MKDLDYWQDYLINHGTSILMSLLLAGLGFWLAKTIRQKLLKIFSKSARNQAVKMFLVNMVYGLVLVVSAIIVLAKLGVPTASLITILGTSSLAIGLAMKDFLANIAAGAIIVFQKPFELGDLVEVSGTLGTVEHIDLFSVRLKTPSHEAIIIPNGTLIKEKIINKAYQGKRRIEMIASVGYDTDLGQAKKIISDLIDQDQRVLSDPKPIVAVKELADSAVNLVAWMWVQSTDYIYVKFDLIEKMKIAFDTAGIKVPFPQREVWLKNEK